MTPSTLLGAACLADARWSAFETRIPPVSREVLFLLTICLLDTASSALFFHFGMATEANPALKPFVEAGIGWFVGAKTLTFVPALVGAEWGIRHRPNFYVPLLRWVGALYVGIYALCVAGQFLPR